jgi:hypothetical protein
MRVLLWSGVAIAVLGGAGWYLVNQRGPADLDTPETEQLVRQVIEEVPRPVPAEPPAAVKPVPAPVPAMELVEIIQLEGELPLEAPPAPVFAGQTVPGRTNRPGVPRAEPGGLRMPYADEARAALTEPLPHPLERILASRDVPPIIDMTEELRGDGEEAEPSP